MEACAAKSTPGTEKGTCWRQFRLLSDLASLGQFVLPGGTPSITDQKERRFEWD